jgi:transcriptional regulator with XRE-family HTH domain
VTGNLNLKTIFGIKLKRLREARHMTLGGFSRQTGLSASYLAEMEAGKKYPRAEKILQLAEALGTSYDDLISTKLDHEFDELQGFLSSPGVRDFPFELFGVPAADLMKLLTRSPHEVGALLRTIGDIARHYNIGVEHFLHAALRSYQELTGNYYDEIEREAESFARTLGGSGRGSVTPKALREWVIANGVSEIDERRLGERPALREFRAVRITHPRVRLLLNPRLGESQKSFVLAREIGYHVLGLTARSLTTPPDREDSFEQVLNDFKASYFAGALLLPRQALTADLRAFFRLPTWQSESLLHLLDTHRVTAETLMYRLSQLVPSQFGLRTHFLRFNDEKGHLRLVKQLNLSQLTIPPGISANEHYCLRWLSTRLLVELAAWQRRRPKHLRHPVVGAQHSKFVDGRSAFFCIGLAQPLPLQPDVNSSLTLGFNADEKFFRTVRFAKDRTIPHATINGTCERCPLSDAECDDRVAAPVGHLLTLAQAERQRELQELAGGR